jgi:hypothetical protein
MTPVGLELKSPWIVITGLVPVIHASTVVILAAAGTWMAGSSPAMTVKSSVREPVKDG